MAKVLVVDDSLELLELFSIILGTKGYEVETANSKTKFINQLHISPPDIILLDVKLSGTDGRELCREIKYKSPHQHIPIILLSADPRLLDDHEECNADDVIEKPFSIKTVITKVTEALEKNQLHRIMT